MSSKATQDDWHPASWQALPAAQQPSYPDQAALERAVADLSRLPPLVTSWEIDALKDEIARAQRGDAFILQGGVVSAFAGLFVMILGAAMLTPVALPLAQRLLSGLPLGGVWRMATRDMQRHISRLGTAAAALLPEGAVSFVHDPGAGEATFQRFTTLDFPREVRKRSIGGISFAQQAEDYALLEALARRHVEQMRGILTAQLERFDDEILVALAAYNGGPGNALQWLVSGFGAYVLVCWIQSLHLSDRAAHAVIAKSPSVWFAIGIASLQLIINYGIMGWTPPYIISKFNQTAAATGAIFGPLAAILGIIGPLIAGPVSDWAHKRITSGRLYITLFSLGVSPLLAIVVYTVDSLTMFYVTFCIYALVLTMWMPPIYAAYLDLVLPRMRAIRSSVHRPPAMDSAARCTTASQPESSPAS